MKTAPLVDATEVIAAVGAASDAYEAALQANDLAGLALWFWQDARVCRWGLGESLYGHEAIQAFRAARSTTGLARTLLRRRIVTFDERCAVVLVEFRRHSDGSLGRQSQTWVQMEDGWRIVMAHISLSPDGVPAGP